MLNLVTSFMSASLNRFTNANSSVVGFSCDLKTLLTENWIIPCFE